jgi:ArsR family transcriptional regulator, arsenate/arsenite/antimonite-responsive transcriptional repressor
MTASKTQKFSREDIRMARFAKAMAHPARVAILRQLASTDKCCFNEISRKLPLADSTVSQHMAELKSAGLVQDNYDPPKVYYSIDTENWKLARKYFKELIRKEQ